MSWYSAARTQNMSPGRIAFLMRETEQFISILKHLHVLSSWLSDRIIVHDSSVEIIGVGGDC